MSKVIYEFFTNPQRTMIAEEYWLVIDRETPRQFHGNVYTPSGRCYGGFSVDKESVNSVQTLGKKSNYMCRSRVVAGSAAEARKMAAEAIYTKLIEDAMKFAENEGIFDEMGKEFKDVRDLFT